MSDKIILDFENNMITWDTDNQKGTEHCPDLAKRKEAILTAMGYENVDFSPVVKVIESYLSGEMTQKELMEHFDEFENE